MAAARNRVRVNVFLALFLPAVVIDTLHPVNDVHEALARKIDVVLDLTGLWQGPWRLYGPEVDKVNLRLGAEIHFADHSVATWSSPEWTETSALRKFVSSRHMNYYSNVLKEGHELAWDGLCAYLARTVPHPQGKAVPVESVSLILRGAIVPDPDEKTVPARPYVDWDEPAVIHTWRAPPP